MAITTFNSIALRQNYCSARAGNGGYPTYAECHAGVGEYVVIYQYTNMLQSFNGHATNPMIDRSKVVFDTSTLLGTITNAELRVYPNVLGGSGESFCVCAGTGLTTDASPPIEYIPMGSCTTVMGSIPRDSLLVNQWNTIPLTDWSSINQSGYTAICLRMSGDIEVSPDNNVPYVRLPWTGTYKKLVVTYTPYVDMVTNDATNVTSSSATLNGSNVGSEVASCHFEWEAYDVDWNVLDSGVTANQNVNGAFSDSISLPSGWYKVYFRAVGTYGSYTDYGSWLNFSPPAIAVTTLDATSIGHTYAVLNGTLSSSTPYFCGFEIGTQTGVYTGLVWVSQPVNNAAYAVGISGLSPETTYFFKAIYNATIGIVEAANEESFTTDAIPAPGPPNYRSYTLRQTDRRGRPIFLAEAKAIDSVYRSIVYETQVTMDGLTTFTQLPSDRPVDIEVRWAKQYRLWENVFESGGDEIGDTVAASHTQNTDDYVKGAMSSAPGTSEGMAYYG